MGTTAKGAASDAVRVVKWATGALTTWGLLLAGLAAIEATEDEVGDGWGEGVVLAADDGEETALGADIEEA